MKPLEELLTSMSTSGITRSIWLLVVWALAGLAFLLAAELRERRSRASRDGAQELRDAPRLAQPS